MRLANIVSTGAHHIYIRCGVLNEVGELVNEKVLHQPRSAPCVDGENKSNARILRGGQIFVGNGNERVIGECGKVLCDIPTIARS